MKMIKLESIILMKYKRPKSNSMNMKKCIKIKHKNKQNISNYLKNKSDNYRTAAMVMVLLWINILILIAQWLITWRTKVLQMN